MEYRPGLPSGTKLPEAEAKILTMQILCGLKVMHENNICHGDINSNVISPYQSLVIGVVQAKLTQTQSVLVASPRTPIVVKLGNFGCAQYSVRGEFFANLEATPYMAPEVILRARRSPYSLKVDMWSLGCLVYWILTEATPFENLEHCVNYALRGGQHRDQPDFLGDGITEEGREFILALMSPLPKHRPTAEVALSHPWLSGVAQQDAGPEQMPILAIDEPSVLATEIPFFTADGSRISSLDVPIHDNAETLPPAVERPIPISAVVTPFTMEQRPLSPRYAEEPLHSSIEIPSVADVQELSPVSTELPMHPLNSCPTPSTIALSHEAVEHFPDPSTQGINNPLALFYKFEVTVSARLVVQKRGMSSWLGQDLDEMWSVGELLGEGGQGTVSVQHSETPPYVRAVKKIPRSTMHTINFKRELDTLIAVRGVSDLSTP